MDGKMIMPINTLASNNNDAAVNFFPTSVFAEMVERMPLIAIDLLVQDKKGQHLLGWRSNPPAQSSWFVPGGRIRKNERLEEAFQRITLTELGAGVSIKQAVFKGIYQHFYSENFLGEQGKSTHYITLAYQLNLDSEKLNLPIDQHAHYRWASSENIQRDPQVHTYTRDYF